MTQNVTVYSARVIKSRTVPVDFLLLIIEAILNVICKIEEIGSNGSPT